MEEEVKKQKPDFGQQAGKKAKIGPSDSQSQLKNQKNHENSLEQQSDDADNSSGWSKEVIEPAIKSMSFRKKRGTHMNQLMKGKHRKDQFWQKYQQFFGGDINKPEDSEDEEDYEASSSGRDQFDSDFDLTDSYVGKRGRKKGTKIKKRKRTAAKSEKEEPEGEPKPKGKRGRKKKVPVDGSGQQKSELLLKKGKKEIELNIEAVFEIKSRSKVRQSNGKEAKQACQFKKEVVCPNSGQKPVEMIDEGRQVFEENVQVKQVAKESQIARNGQEIA